MTSLDIIGFGELVARAGVGKVERLLREIRFYDRLSESTANAYDEGNFALGDHAVRVVPLDSAVNWPHSIGLPFREMLHLVHAQANLMAHRLWLRGAITVGEVAFGKNFIFGPGLVAAEQLRATIARYPRIVLDPYLLRELEEDPLLRKDTHDISEEQEYVRSLLREDGDGVWFIDYLGAFATEVDEPEQYYYFLRDHQQVIEERLRLVKEFDESALGWGWLAGYHNRVIRTPPKGHTFTPEELKELLIKIEGRSRYRFTLLDK